MMKFIPNCMWRPIKWVDLRWVTGVMIGGLIISIGCSAAPKPMSVKMVHPESKQTLTCSARDQLGRADNALLASAVESCVKSLQARGFVIQD